MLLIALPFSVRALFPDAVSSVWLFKPNRRVKEILNDLTGMPIKLTYDQ
jgi:hypothetical protein